MAFCCGGYNSVTPPLLKIDGDINCQLFEHNKEKVKLICTEPNCEQNRLCCVYCTLFHPNHVDKVIRITDFITQTENKAQQVSIKIDELVNADKYLKDFSQLQKLIQFKCEELLAQFQILLYQFQGNLLLQHIEQQLKQDEAKLNLKNSYEAIQKSRGKNLSDVQNQELDFLVNIHSGESFNNAFAEQKLSQEEKLQNLRTLIDQTYQISHNFIQQASESIQKQTLKLINKEEDEELIIEEKVNIVKLQTRIQSEPILVKEPSQSINEISIISIHEQEEEKTLKQVDEPVIIKKLDTQEDERQTQRKLQEQQEKLQSEMKHIVLPPQDTPASNVAKMIEEIPDLLTADMKNSIENKVQKGWSFPLQSFDPQFGKVYNPFQYLSNGDIYEGQYKLGKRNGRGKMTYYAGGVYEGQWREDQYNGLGRYIAADGDIYEGEFVDGQKCGKGKYLDFQTNTVYDGYFKNDSKNGKGVEVYGNGTIYDGEYLNDQRNGQGTLTDNFGVQYIGQFVNGKKHGKGRLIEPDKGYYDGQFENDKIQGQGSYTYEDGNKHIGFYVNGQKHGYGKYFFNDGRVYEGTFERDKMHGEGKMVFEDGSTRKGKWVNGQRIEWLDDDE